MCFNSRLTVRLSVVVQVHLLNLANKGLVFRLISTINNFREQRLYIFSRYFSHFPHYFPNIIHHFYLQHMTSAHKDWVTSLNFVPGYDVLVSGDRRGIMRLWDIKSCKPIGKSEN